MPDISSMKTTYETICKAIQGITADSTNTADIVSVLMQIQGTELIRSKWCEWEPAGTIYVSTCGQSWIRASEEVDKLGNSLTIRVQLEYYE